MPTDKNRAKALDALEQAISEGTALNLMAGTGGKAGSDKLPMRPIALGETVVARLGPNDPILNMFGQSYSDIYYFDTAMPNQRVAITMMRPTVPSPGDMLQNASLTPLILLCKLHSDGFSLINIANFDDGNYNARDGIWPHYVDVGPAGRYYIIATSLPPDLQVGDYSLTLTPEPGVPGARVAFSRVSGDGRAPAPVVTDQNGLWKQSSFEEGTTYRVTVSKPGYTFDPQYISFSSNTPALNLDLNGPYIQSSFSKDEYMGEVLHPGEVVSIPWAYTGDPASRVRINLKKSGFKVKTIAENLPAGTGGQGSYQWTVPADLPDGNDYEFEVTALATPAAVDTSKSVACAYCSFTGIGHPNQSDTWTAGTLQTISWNYVYGDPGQISIMLLKGNSLNSVIARSATGDVNGAGQYDWKIPYDLSSGQDYRVFIASLKDPSCNAVSDYFTINAAPASPSNK